MNHNKDIFDKIMDWKIMSIFRPFYIKYKEALLYLFFGGLTFFVNILSYVGFERVLHFNPLIANIFAWIIGVVFAYVTNRIWVFEYIAKKWSGIAKEFASFCGARLITLGIEELLLYCGINLLHIDSVFVKVVAQIVVIVLNYVFSKFFVFRNNTVDMME